MFHALSVDKVLETRAQFLYDENQKLGLEIEQLNREKSQWSLQLQEAKREAEKLKARCLVLEDENETLRMYINS